MLLVVGEIVRPHGVGGEVVVELHTDDPQERFAPGSVLLADPGAARPPGGAEPPARSAGPADPAGPANHADAAEAVGVGSAPVRWPPERLTVRAARPHHGRLIVALEGIDDRDLAERLRGVLLRVDSADLPPLDDPDEFHDHQLVGLAAVSVAGEALGEVVRIEHAPASELLVLRRPGGGTALVPFVKAIVPEVDLTGGRVVVAAPEGLLDL